MSQDQKARQKYEHWCTTFIKAARQANTQIAEHETIAREIENLEPHIKMVIIKAFLEAKEKFSNATGNFRFVGINIETAYCFGFSDDVEQREAWLLRSCLTVYQKNSHLKKIVGIAANKSQSKNPSYHFCMIDLTKETPENIAVH